MSDLSKRRMSRDEGSRCSIPESDPRLADLPKILTHCECGSTFPDPHKKGCYAYVEPKRRGPQQKVIEALVQFVIADSTCCLSAWSKKPESKAQLPSHFDEFEEHEAAVVETMLCLNGKYPFVRLKYPGQRGFIEIEWRDNDWFYTYEGETLTEARLIEKLKL